MKRWVISFAGSLLLMAGAVSALTLDDIESRIRINVRDTATDTSLQRYSDATLDGLINDGQRDVVNQTWCLDEIYSFSLVSGTSYYALPTDLIAIKFVQYVDISTNTTFLVEKNERSFIQGHPDWGKQYGKPVEYFVRGKPGSTTYEMGMYPYPNAAAYLGTVTVDYYKQATDMTGGSDVPFDSLSAMVPYHDSLIYYATTRIKIIEGRIDEATMYGQLYNNMVQTINTKFGAKPNWTPSFSGAIK